MKKKIVIFLILVVVVAAAGIVLKGFYPVIFVNGHSISFKSFRKNYAAAMFYYRKTLETYDRNQLPIIDSSEVKQEIECAVLSQSIEDVLVAQELKKQIKNKQLKMMVENKVNETLADKEVEEEIKTLFNLSVEDFKEMVLKPQAKKEILEGRLFLDNKNLEDWLKESKSGAKVIILLTEFEWKDGEVAIK